MARIAARTNEDRALPRIDDLDAETLRLVRFFLAASEDRRRSEPRLGEAWARFYAACDPLIRWQARHRCGRVFEQEDRVQEVWQVIVARLSQYDPERGPFLGWLTRVVRHVLDDQDRSHHRLRQLVVERERQLPGREGDPADLYELGQSRQEVASAMKELRARVSETNYRIIREHWLVGRTFEEIALSLGLTVKQVRDPHHRAMEKLRELLS
jgi:RNA polymerase sigma factor (sigma-70 family)